MLEQIFGRHKTVDAVVIGAGPVGLCAAALLRSNQLSVEVVDTRLPQSAGPNVVAPAAGSLHRHVILDPHGLSVLEAVGIAQPVLAAAQRIERIGLYDGGRRIGELRLDEMAAPFPCLAAVSQDTLHQQLLARLSEAKVPVSWGQRLKTLSIKDGSAHLQLDRFEDVSQGYAVVGAEAAVRNTRELEARVVIGADGHDSMVRRQLGIEFIPSGAPVLELVVEIQPAADLGGEMRIVLGDSSEALWPLPGGSYRWVLPLDEATAREHVTFDTQLDLSLESVQEGHVNEAFVEKVLAERAALAGLKTARIGSAFAVRFQPGRAESLGRGRAWLVGSAATVTNPALRIADLFGLEQLDELIPILAGAAAGPAPEQALNGYVHRQDRELSFAEGKGAINFPGRELDGSKTESLLRLLPVTGSAREELFRRAHFAH